MRLPFGIATTLVRRSWCSAANRRPISIADVTAQLPPARVGENVPRKYLSDVETKGTWNILRWLLQKDSLGQDVFLLGPPGSIRRRIVFAYLEYTGREAEYVALSADTTDSDLKQYRELSSSQAGWRDQAAVRAATKGRVLVLDGVERAERNLLPLINNLLENREMHLDDGGFLLRSDKFDALASEVGLEKLLDWGMRRVHEDFRVVALGLPVPPFKCKALKFPDFDDASTELRALAPSSNTSQQLKPLLNIVYTINTPQLQELGLPFFSYDSCQRMVKLMELKFSLSEALDIVYPSFHLSDEARKSIADIVTKEDRSITKRRGSRSVIAGKASEMSCFAIADTQIALSRKHSDSTSRLVLTPSFTYAADTLLKVLSIGDVCVIGPRGSGKNTLARFVAERLGYKPKSVQRVGLYKDMSGRELLQSRRLEDGTTIWRDSPIVSAALEGNCLILDGIDVLDPTVLSSLQCLIFERELWLSDGTKLLRHDRWEAIGATGNARPVHPKFKIIALAEPPKADSLDRTWLTSEVSSMFMTLYVPTCPAEEMASVISALVGNEPPSELLKAVTALRSSTDASLRSLSDCLSTRQLIRICRKLSAYPTNSLYELLTEAMLIKFAPQLTKMAFDESLSACGIENSHNKTKTLDTNNLDIKVDRTTVTIGDVVIPRSLEQKAPAKIPSTLYYKNPRQLQQLYRIAQDLVLGEHLLLVGNQGVGKNKIIDHLLAMCNRPREYMQLHRDSTIASLSVQPQLIDGSVVYQDSPLLKALVEGHVAVIDEADKAPVQVVRMLHSLLARGEMQILDGRRIVSKPKELAGPQEIAMHPNFQAIVLANRPGFPFMGHDFFPLIGDAMAVHSIDAPDAPSERALLANYAPNLSAEQRIQLVDLFADLRELYDSGQIKYPFSTRELVNVARHLSAFPADGALQALANVLDFDSYEPNARKLIGTIIRKYGIPFDTDASNIFLAETHELGPWINVTSFNISWNRTDDINKKPIKFVDQLFLKQGSRIQVTSSFPRLDRFTELSQQFRVPFSRIKELLISGGTPHVISFEGQPIVGTLDLKSRVWNVKSIPLASKELLAFGLRDPDPGKFALLDQSQENLYMTNLSQNVINLSNVPSGKILHRGFNRLIIKTKPNEVVVMPLKYPMSFYWSLTLNESVSCAVPFGSDQLILLNKSLLYDLEKNRVSFASLPNGLKFLDHDIFNSDLHIIGQVRLSDDQATLSAVYRPKFESCEEAVALGAGMTAATMSGPPYGLEYIKLQANRVSRLPLNQKNSFLRACDTIPGRLYSLEQTRQGWHLNTYTLATAELGRELEDWQRTLGSNPRHEPKGPKHGRTDNEEHHGGNTWAGGTGGSDTAGLGGVGGPYRLDKGFDVHQVSDEIKGTVPRHIKEQAKQIAREALERRLKEINMSDSEHNVYRDYLESVKTSSQTLRVILEGLEGKRREREWVRHRSEGDIDEVKLVEAAAGENNVFKRRMSPQDFSRGIQEKPKRLSLLVDVSGSMYRFNGYDGRLQREMEAVILLMDALHGFQHKIQYEIRGHSGEASNIPLVKSGEPPADERGRLEVLKKMYAHAQYCLSGDFTLQAVQQAVAEMSNCDDFDENCVILLSDANLERYGISARLLAKAMTARQPLVQVYAVLIGSLGAQAHALKRELPPGHGFICMETRELPQIIKQIFTAKLIS
ncbi:von Willebrand factor A domain-containing protein 8-like isoform X2 [Varroa destructor]|uniref:VWFA domain-containing protein n=1 Tax=Varroa destructor TaxID=109461 RepID=A0A7M7KSU8_VARDE|nr:von Willebrand factor A domain-containing protein 8-like isoform X2 [Varroa destructor]